MTPSHGLVANSATIISLIQTNLKDRYASGFPVLKELIQNADDAGAGLLRLGWAAETAAPGRNPLLACPALFAINDGPFGERDAWAIRQFGLSSKGGDEATIGKFGLGMKSVFHLAEAVFYLSSGGVSGQLNPWCADGMGEPALRRGWAEFGDEQHRWLTGKLRACESI